jgi:hypothetical protein
VTFSFSIAKRTREVFKFLEENSRAHPLGLDFAMHGDAWTRDYASFTVDINEPDDDVRILIDMNVIRKQLADSVHAAFGPSFKLCKDSGTVLSNSVPSPVIVWRTLGAGWTVEFEVYRTDSGGHSRPDVEWTSSRTAAKKPEAECGCIELANRQLKAHGIRLDLGINPSGGPTRCLLSVSRLSGASKRLKSKVVSAKFCPFCGLWYGGEQ